MRRHAPGPLQPTLDLDSAEATPEPVPARQAGAWRFSDAVLAKARTYLDSGAVCRGERTGWWWVTGSRAYRVQTDADPVMRTATWITCTCPHGSNTGAGSARCSHAVAVLMAVTERRLMPVRHAS